MKKILIVTGILIFFSNAFGQNMREYASYSLFSDQKANRIGDAITIIVVESSQASNKAETSTGRDSDIGFEANGGVGNNAMPNVDFGLGSKNDFRGSGSTQTSGMIRTKISATIDSVLNNGNLLIKGSRIIRINGEEQRMFISGIVRTSDIAADNSVLSYNISEAEITFEGDGLVQDAQKPGWLTKLFHWVF